MSARFPLALLVVLAIASVSAAPQQPTKAADPKDQEIETLRQLYADELTRNETLSQEIQQLHAKLNALQSRLVLEQQRIPGTDRIPQHWKPFEFNGMRVLLVPLTSEPTPAAGHP